MTHYFVWVMNEQHQKNIFLNIKNKKQWQQLLITF